MTTISPTSRRSTAQVLATSAPAVDRVATASVGIAAHHLTDHLVDLHPTEQHRATTVLTKQVMRVLGADDAFRLVEQLVTDPNRRAMPDGRSASTLCGEHWTEVAEIAGQRAALAREGAADFGADAIVNLAFVRALDSIRPWWGTARWTRQVDGWFETSGFRAKLHDQLISSPEDVAEEILWDVMTYASPA